MTRAGHSGQFQKGCPLLSTSGGGHIGFFKMAATENEGIYFVSYLLFYFMYSNDSGVYYYVSGVKESDYNVKTTKILINGGDLLILLYFYFYKKTFQQ